MDKYPLSESNRNIFLVELNKAIEDAAEDDSKNILQQDFDSLSSPKIPAPSIMMATPLAP